MNIFFLDKDPLRASSMYGDKHVGKLIVEVAQMCSTALHRHGLHDEAPYKSAYEKHPMTIWVGDTGGNFYWSLRLLDELLNQYEKRYKKIHKSKKIYKLLSTTYNKWHTLKPNITPPPQCMPDEYKHKDYITAYKQYYVGEKKRFAKYTGVDTPDFMC